MFSLRREKYNLIELETLSGFQIILTRLKCTVKTWVKLSLKVSAVTLNIVLDQTGVTDVHFCFQHNHLFCYRQYSRSLQQGVLFLFFLKGLQRLFGFEVMCAGTG